MLALDDCSSRLLSMADVAIFQDLYERCSDFHELSEGTPTRPTAAAYDLEATPSGRSTDDKFLFGIFRDGLLIAVVDLFRDFPYPREWWLSLLMLDPNVRSRGLGRRIVEAAITWSGTPVMWIAVLEANPRAERFWRNAGFEEVERQDYRSDTGKAHRVILMRRRAS